MSKQFVVFDTETTSVFPKTAVMLSMSMVTCEKNGNELALGPTGRFVDMYFTPMSEVPESAARINHLNKALLKEKSNNRTLSDQYEDIVGILHPGVNVIGHNISYDITVVENNFARNGLPRPTFGEVIDTMKLARKYLKKGKDVIDYKLVTVFKWCLKKENMTEEDFIRSYQLTRRIRQFQKLTIGEPLSMEAHTASYDTYMTFFVAKVLMGTFTK